MISVFWALYRVKNSESDLLSVFVSNFSVSFFLTSWLLGQVTRVRRQQRIEDEFSSVKSELQKLLNSLEVQTQHLIGHTTGGDSVGYFEPTFWSRHRLEFMFTNVSKYPVFDVFAEWIDLDEPIEVEKGKFWTRHRITLGTVHPNKVAMNVFGFDMASRKRLRINIFGQTRNGGFVQQVHVAKGGADEWKVAVMTNFGEFNEQKIPADFPGYDPADPKKIFGS